MGLLFVFENDDTASGPSFDVGVDAHTTLISATRATSSGFPLFRRLSDYYRDASFDVDELKPLMAELRLLWAADPATVDALLDLAQTALSCDLGLLIICD